MAAKSTIFKAELSVSDMTRNYYHDHALTIARHPTETDLRMLARIVAFALNAHERLQYSKGLSSDEEPDLWQLGLSGDIEHWIDLGQVAFKRIRQSCSKAERVSVYTYQKGATKPWFDTVKDEVQRFDHLTIAHLSFDNEYTVGRLVDKSMRLSCTIEDDQVLLSNHADSIAVTVERLF